MKVVSYAGAGGSEVIILGERPAPIPSALQVQVRVHASALNRADLLQRLGHYPAPSGWPADVPGLEYAGTVEQCGADVTRWQVGDRVMGLVGGGAHAELVVAHQDEVLPIPAQLSFADAAAIPEAFLTAFDALMIRARLRRDERVLVHAIGSGVGTAAVQLAKAAGAVVLGTSRTTDKLAAAQALGMSVGILPDARGFRSAVGEPVHVVVDVLGAPAFAENLAVLAVQGRLILLGFLAGSRAELDLEAVLRKRIQVIGTVMRTRALDERIELARRFAAEVLPLFESGTVRPVIGRRVAMVDIAEAHGMMERGEVFGKIVLEWGWA